jgi:hypothetical protein
VVKNFAQVKLHCSDKVACQGAVRLWYGHLLLGYQSYKMAAGTSEVVNVRLAAKPMKLLTKAKGHILKILETVLVSGGKTLRLSGELRG